MEAGFSGQQEQHFQHFHKLSQPVELPTKAEDVSGKVESRLGLCNRCCHCFSAVWVWLINKHFSFFGRLDVRIISITLVAETTTSGQDRTTPLISPWFPVD